VNGDGKLDLVAANVCFGSSNCVNGSVGVLINTSLMPTTTAIVSSLNPSNFGQAVTFTATVTPQGTGTPTGTVSFFDGTTNIGNSSLNGSGVAVFTISTLAVGMHSIAGIYNGDFNFATSTSPILSQVVQGAVVVLSQTNLNFGNQTVGIISNPQSVTLMNAGNISLTVSALGITGMNSTDFAQTNTCGTFVSAGGSCTITVTFEPLASGTKTASLSIADNAPKSPQQVPLSGVGVLPAVTLSPTSLTFPTQVVFTTSKAQTVKLTNTGLGVLKIMYIAVTGPFSQTNTCSSTMNPGGSCTLNVTFTPISIGVLKGSVSITDNAPLSSQKVMLKGTGTYVQLTPASLNFGNQPVGTTSLPKTITLSNKGHMTVSITSIVSTGLNASDFSLTNTCGTSVAPGVSCFIKVKFKPKATGKRSAAVAVTDNGGGSPQKVSLTGAGT